MTQDAISADQVERWGRRVPRVLTFVSNIISFIVFLLLVSWLMLEPEDRARTGAGYGIAAVLAYVLVPLALLGAASLRRRYLPPDEAGFDGLGRTATSGWRAGLVEHGPIVLGVIVTAALGYILVPLVPIALEEPDLILKFLVVFFVLMGPIAIGYGFRHRRRFREWKRQMEGRD